MDANSLFFWKWGKKGDFVMASCSWKILEKFLIKVCIKLLQNCYLDLNWLKRIIINHYSNIINVNSKLEWSFKILKLWNSLMTLSLSFNITFLWASYCFKMFFLLYKISWKVRTENLKQKESYNMSYC